ncbi:unnamed protein product [Schistosoma rodhaini]|nr:unnamed protein product [Schistosoma rodhaini]
MPIIFNSLADNNTLLITPSGKRRRRKPGLNSTVEQRKAANAREKCRMSVLSSAFVELKRSLPWVPKDMKLSKLDTLKHAAGYIFYLRRVLSIPESHFLTSKPSAVTVVQSGLSRTETSLKPQSYHPNFENNSNSLDSTLPDTLMISSFVANSSCFKKYCIGNYSKYSYENIGHQDEEFLLNRQHNQ